MPRSLLPRLLSFDVFGTLINVREGSYGVFRSILMDVPGGSGVDVRAFFEYWEERNIADYRNRTVATATSRNCRSARPSRISA